MKIHAMFLAFILLIAGCGGNNITAGVTAIDGVEKMENKIVTVETSKGVIKFELFEDKAPITTKNFIELVGKGFYDGLTFHRVEPGFVIQGGDPNGDGTGGSGKNIPLEIHKDLRHTKGTVAMARSQDPNSASSQFYITLADTPFLDDNYAVFGRVVEGMDVVESIKVGDKMDKVTIK
ncbi:MAG: peptidylprolyl isomerase [Candidatus Woesearchaeota archaeon]|jgi:cyclophilin family peptidyl-prolyl cis-trans isomerase|nr:peptidylprolyl isomerase [Candidatus Woesearchaeota archaeon]MDP7622550.1 peptidylprolyl isomerase [Candidatus Woesearchaeota archaeon]HJN56693.1 peptidylprolyl isomerase [Candidatus Woesearchaeota archaeon]|tara:strand:+ start:7466 stop:7999 length:534 start_codon:yes stop_codon:yes gene_type:complete